MPRVRLLGGCRKGQTGPVLPRVKARGGGPSGPPPRQRSRPARAAGRSAPCASCPARGSAGSRGPRRSPTAARAFQRSACCPAWTCPDKTLATRRPERSNTSRRTGRGRGRSNAKRVAPGDGFGPADRSAAPWGARRRRPRPQRTDARAASRPGRAGQGPGQRLVGAGEGERGLVGRVEVTAVRRSGARRWPACRRAARVEIAHDREPPVPAVNPPAFTASRACRRVPALVVDPDRRVGEGALQMRAEVERSARATASGVERCHGVASTVPESSTLFASESGSSLATVSVPLFTPGAAVLMPRVWFVATAPAACTKLPGGAVKSAGGLRL